MEFYWIMVILFIVFCILFAVMWFITKRLDPVSKSTIQPHFTVDGDDKPRDDYFSHIF